MTMQASAAMIQAARDLAVPTIRSILRKRRNAIKFNKAQLLIELNQDLVDGVRAALSLGVDGALLVANTTQHPDDSRVLASIVMREES